MIVETHPGGLTCGKHGLPYVRDETMRPNNWRCDGCVRDREVALGDLPSRLIGWIGKARRDGRDRIELNLATAELLLSAALQRPTISE